jgi:FkbM family methyltransferase
MPVRQSDNLGKDPILSMRQLALLLARFLPQPVKSFVHRNRQIDKTMSAIYGWMIRRHGSVATIEGGANAGLRLRVSPHTSHAHIRGTYEAPFLDAIAASVRPGMVCYDVGASIGYVSLLLARTSRKVYAFEPSPVAREEIAAHLNANQISHVEVVPHPVSDARRTVKFGLTDNAYGSAIAREEGEWPTLDLETIALDEFAATHEQPDLIKIDIEGEEGNALRGAIGLLRDKKPIICCELHSREVSAEVVSLLESHGYVVTNLDGSAFQLPDVVVPGDLQVCARPRQSAQVTAQTTV